MKKCVHKFKLVCTSSWEGLVSRHGRCSKCGAEMVRMGKIDKKGNGTLQECVIGDIDYGILYLVKDNKVI